MGIEDEDDLKALRKMVLSLSMRLHTSIEYLNDMSINEMKEIIEDLNEMAEERDGKQKRI